MAARFFKGILFSLAAVFISAAGAEAMNMAKDITLGGFLQGNYSVDTARSNPDGDYFKLAEERLQLRQTKTLFAYL